MEAQKAVEAKVLEQLTGPYVNENTRYAHTELRKQGSPQSTSDALSVPVPLV